MNANIKVSVFHFSPTTYFDHFFFGDFVLELTLLAGEVLVQIVDEFGAVEAVVEVLDAAAVAPRLDVRLQVLDYVVPQRRVLELRRRVGLLHCAVD